jgi:trans-aconitate 2-methyltransferase
MDMASWDPDVYDLYKDYRDRPALDLMLRIPEGAAPREIWDLGCGTGEQAALLAARHPQAAVHGLDSSADMLAAARRRRAAVDWVQGDIADFAPQVAPDLIYTNAALQWLDDHERLFPRLASLLAAKGVLACQMPMAFDADWHEALRQTAREPRWSARLDQVRSVRPTGSLGDYHDWLSPCCDRIDIWATTYLHLLEGDDPIVDWMRGTALRPYLDAFPDSAEQAAFLDAYRARLATLMPARADGVTLFPFPRLFIVARRRADPGRPVLPG